MARHIYIHEGGRVQGKTRDAKFTPHADVDTKTMLHFAIVKKDGSVIFKGQPLYKTYREAINEAEKQVNRERKKSFVGNLKKYGLDSPAKDSSDLDRVVFLMKKLEIEEDIPKARKMNPIKLKTALNELESRYKIAKPYTKGAFDSLQKYESFPEHEKAMQLFRKLKTENKNPKFEETKSLSGGKLYKVSWKDSQPTCGCQHAAKDAGSKFVTKADIRLPKTEKLGNRSGAIMSRGTVVYKEGSMYRPWFVKNDYRISIDPSLLVSEE